MVKGIFDKLNIMEQAELNKYINQEVSKKVLENTNLLHQAADEKEKILTDLNDKTWNLINDYLTLSMRENRISQERVDAIYKRFKELVDNSQDKLLIELGKQPSKDYEIMSKDDLSDIIEELYIKCKNCTSKKKDCRLHKLYEKHNIPAIDGYKKSCKCKYSWRG